MSHSYLIIVIFVQGSLKPASPLNGNPMRRALGVNGERNWISQKLQGLPGTAATGMDRVHPRNMVSLAEGRNSETVTVPCVGRLTRGGYVRTEPICQTGPNKAIVNEKLNLDSLRLVSRADCPSFDRM